MMTTDKLPHPSGRIPSVLCVDDETQVLRALERTLDREPYQVLRACRGTEALDLLERFPIQVIIADQRMPGMSGSDLLAEVRRRWPLVGRILLTGYPGPDVMTRGLEVETEFLLVKPWNENDLRRIIRCLIVDPRRPGASDSGVIDEGWCDLGGEGG
jgi:two-component system response regulator HupR/HoxA